MGQKLTSRMRGRGSAKCQERKLVRPIEPVRFVPSADLGSSRDGGELRGPRRESRQIFTGLGLNSPFWRHGFASSIATGITTDVGAHVESFRCWDCPLRSADRVLQRAQQLDCALLDNNVDGAAVRLSAFRDHP